ncbi:glycosyltransferase family 39 protein [Massilia horti]|uniref:Uncharacterized protein n=1 Tax=Massilia horti TaxID=2562153 RepID=A0A4Y9SUK6_9BURK|nr:glycosyltransferase family 39 protein [Massilia horti]TFW30400.1 hypothetical protein E4O92_17085 [Massilia horti]
MSKGNAAMPGSRVSALVLAAMMAVALGALLVRNIGLNPAIFSDEWYYSKMARLDPVSAAMVPSYLYLWVFSASNACGDRFLDCVRVGNALFFVGGAPFVYLIARQVISPRLSLFATALSLLAPLNLHTTFFMPESMYYFGFCVLSWVALTRTGWHWATYAFTTGAVLGLLALVKVHAVFLLPALCLFVLYVTANRESLATGLVPMLLTAGAAALVRFGLGFLFAGRAGLELFGSFYGSGARQAAHHTLAQLLPPALVNAWGHLMALALVLALPMALLLEMVVSKGARARAAPQLIWLQVYALLMLVAAAGMTIAFTASLAGAGATEVIRLHMRYYDFVFPLLFIVGAAQLGQADTARRPLLAWTIALFVAALLVAGVVFLPHYLASAPDGPDLAGIDLRRWFWRAIFGLDLLVLFLWARGSRHAGALFLFAALPLAILAADRGVQRYVRQLVTSWGPDNAGRFAHRYVPPREHKEVTLVGSDMAELFRVQFYLDDKDAVLVDLPPGAPVDPCRLPSHNKWLLVVGDHPLPAGMRPVAATKDYALVRLAAPMCGR